MDLEQLGESQAGFWGPGLKPAEVVEGSCGAFLGAWEVLSAELCLNIELFLFETFFLSLEGTSSQLLSIPALHVHPKAGNLFSQARLKDLWELCASRTGGEWCWKPPWRRGVSHGCSEPRLSS